MAKTPGSTKTGGRKKGTPNRRTLAFSEALESQGVDLLGDVLKAAKGLPEAGMTLPLKGEKSCS